MIQNEITINSYINLRPSCVKNTSVKTASPLPLIVAPVTDIVYGINGSIRSKHSLIYHNMSHRVTSHT